MKNYIFYLLILFSLLIVACSKTNNPVAINEHHNPVHGTSTVGMEIEFNDTCSYNFVLSFLSQFDSIKIQSTYLGGYYYIYGDSGDFNFWYEYFRNDSTVQSLYTISSNSDSLILKFSLSGQKSLEEEEQIFSNINHLHIIKYEAQPKLVYVSIIAKSYYDWEKSFMEYAFINHAYTIVSITETDI